MHLEMVGNRMQKWSTGHPSVTDLMLAGDMARLLDVLDEHLRAEEEQVVPLMEKHIAAVEVTNSLHTG